MLSVLINYLQLYLLSFFCFSLQIEEFHTYINLFLFNEITVKSGGDIKNAGTSHLHGRQNSEEAAERDFELMIILNRGCENENASLHQ